jgi:outer membrane protein TolC
LLAYIPRFASNFLLSTVCGLLAAYCLFFVPYAIAEDLKLQDLIDEALKKNPELLAAESMVSVSAFRISQAKSLPDPMFMFGYQNEGSKSYTYGKMPDAQWMFSVSQMFPFPGKLALKGEMSERETESLRAFRDSVRLKTIVRIKEIYYDLFLAYKDLELIKEKSVLFKRTEDAAIARYSAGMGSQQEVLMAQAEKYMLLEKEEMLKQKIQSSEAMLNATLGRDIYYPLGRPLELPSTPYSCSLDMLIKKTLDNSPEIKSKEMMSAAADARIRMAKKEYIPDFTLNAGYFNRAGGQFEDMWSLTTTINIPIYFKSKQKQAVLETEASLALAKYELEGTKAMITSAIRDNCTMIVTAERLMELYKNALIPKIHQDFELSISGYGTGKVEAITVITRLKSLFDYEFLYWEQFTGREKAIARLEAITGMNKGLSVPEKR